MEEGIIEVLTIHSSVNPADVSTKPVHIDKFKSARNLVNVKSFDSKDQLLQRMF